MSILIRNCGAVAKLRLQFKKSKQKKKGRERISMEKPIEPGNTTKLKINFELRTFRSREKFRTYIWAKARSSFEYSRDEISRLPLEFSCKTP